MKRTLRLVIAMLVLMGVGDVKGQQRDTIATEVSNEIIDPAQNRLFMMSTGRTMPPEKFSIADFEVFLLQLGYAPTDFIHFNASYIIPIGGGNSPYWSLGTKVQVIQPAGAFQGLAIGGDIGFFEVLFEFSSTTRTENLVSLNAAMSIGNETAKIHFNIAHFVNGKSSSSSSVGFPSYSQIGADVRLSNTLKFIVEATLPSSQNGLNGSLILAGFRAMGKKFAGDFAWGFFKATSTTFTPSGYPFVSLNFFL